MVCGQAIPVVSVALCFFSPPFTGTVHGTRGGQSNKRLAGLARRTEEKMLRQTNVEWLTHRSHTPCISLKTNWQNRSMVLVVRAGALPSFASSTTVLCGAFGWGRETQRLNTGETATANASHRRTNTANHFNFCQEHSCV